MYAKLLPKLPPEDLSAGCVGTDGLFPLSRTASLIGEAREAIIDSNKSGTAECRLAFVSLSERDGGFFWYYAIIYRR
jgi:hypothetical protein